MSKQSIKGDLIHLARSGQLDVIIHGCNCFNTMGAGIAKQVKATFPLAYEADANTKYGDKRKLGTFSSALVTMPSGHTIEVINAYTQFRYGSGGPHADSHAIRRVFSLLADRYKGSRLRIGYPKIGAGLAGGNWEDIAKIIDEELAGCEHVLVEYQDR